jgi:hypothetical protein
MPRYLQKMIFWILAKSDVFGQKSIITFILDFWSLMPIIRFSINFQVGFLRSEYNLSNTLLASVKELKWIFLSMDFWNSALNCVALMLQELHWKGEFFNLYELVAIGGVFCFIYFFFLYFNFFFFGFLVAFSFGIFSFSLFYRQILFFLFFLLFAV